MIKLREPATGHEAAWDPETGWTGHPGIVAGMHVMVPRMGSLSRSPDGWQDLVVERIAAGDPYGRGLEVVEHTPEVWDDGPRDRYGNRLDADGRIGMTD